MMDRTHSYQHIYAPSHQLALSIRHAITDSGGWMPFDRFMQLALYAPGLGYYAHDSIKLGLTPADGSDFVTAPELSPLFGQALTVQITEALRQTSTDMVWEFGAGTGALAEQILDALAAQGVALRQYAIVDVSDSLRQRQQQRLARFGDIVRWCNSLPDVMHGVVLGNEVLDAMPVQLLHRRDGAWYERGVVACDLSDSSGHFAFNWADRPTSLRPPAHAQDNKSIAESDGDYLTEIHPQAEAFMTLLGERLQRGAAFFIDYGFGEREYYHPQRIGGTLMCHQGHRADMDPLQALGDKDITTHVNFTGIAVAAKQAGMNLLGYTTQAWFLINCGLGALMDQASLKQRTLAQRLVMEHEMGELFKVIGLCAGQAWPARGFAQGDRMRSL